MGATYQYRLEHPLTAASSQPPTPSTAPGTTTIASLPTLYFGAGPLLYCTVLGGECVSVHSSSAVIASVRCDGTRVRIVARDASLVTLTGPSINLVCIFIIVCGSFILLYFLSASRQRCIYSFSKYF